MVRACANSAHDCCPKSTYVNRICATLSKTTSGSAATSQQPAGSGDVDDADDDDHDADDDDDNAHDDGDDDDADDRDHYDNSMMPVDMHHKTLLVMVMVMVEFV